MTWVLTIDGMSCGHCSARVNEALSAVPGVLSVKVSHQKGNAQVKGEGLDGEVLKNAVTDAGYTVTDLKEKKGLFG